MRGVLLALLSLCLSGAAAASDFVDFSLTWPRLQGLLSSPVHRALNGRMVLWQGVVVTQTLHGAYTDLVLQVGSQGQLPVRYRRTCPTLQQDRTGYRVAVKGRLRIDQDHVAGLNGVSLILLEPSPSQGFVQFERRLSLHTPSMAQFIGWRFSFHHPEYPDAKVLGWGKQVVSASTTEHVDPLLLAALMQIESAYDVGAVSHSGAMGLGQLMSFTAAGMGLDARDPLQNIQGSAHYLGGLLTRFAHWPNPVRYSLAAYNAGPQAVEHYGAVPPLAETSNYVSFVSLVWKELQSESRRYGIPGPPPP